MKTLSLICVILFCGFSAAANSPVVSIDLAACGGSLQQKYSGFIVKIRDQDYVISTSWAQLSRSSAKTGCEVVSGEQGVLKTRPVVTDHLAGLSLFLVLDPVADSFTSTPSSGIEFQTADGQLKRISGNILLQQSRRHSIPNLATCLEWKSNQGILPAQVLGAPLWNVGSWVGLVSHQYMEQPKGRPLQVFPWNLQSNESHDHLVVIPKDAILRWIDAQLAQILEPVIWPAEKQLQGVATWIAGDYQFSADCPSATGTPASGHYPIGGHDGIGIGGGDLQQASCKIQSTKSATTSAWSPVDFIAWRNLSPANAAQSIYSLDRDAQGVLTTKSYKSLEDFFGHLLRGSNKNWVEISDQSSATDSLQKSATIFRNEILKCHSNIYVADAGVHDLIQRLYVLTWASTSVSFSFLQAGDVQQALDRNGVYKSGWKFLEWEGACLNKVRPAAETWSQEILKKWAN